MEDHTGFEVEADMLPQNEEVIEVNGLKTVPSNLVSHRMSQATDNSEAQPQISTYAAISKLIWGGFGCSPETQPQTHMKDVQKENE